MTATWLTDALLLRALLVLVLVLVVILRLLWRRIERVEAFWQVVGALTDGELAALNMFRTALRKMEHTAAEDARLESRRHLREKEKAMRDGTRLDPKPELMHPPKKGRSSDAG